MVTTIELDKLTENTITLYEAVMVVAKRARQINNEERVKMELNLGTEEAEDEFDEFPMDLPTQVFERKIKPTKQAIGELIVGDINIIRRIDEEVQGQRQGSREVGEGQAHRHPQQDQEGQVQGSVG